MKIVAAVPIKLNNERTPGKNIKPFFDGTPLIKFILRALKKVVEINEIYVFCSDERIKSYLEADVKFLKRSQYLDTPDATPQDIISEFMKRVDADIYIFSHATSPFVTSEHIRECVMAVKSGEYDSAFTGEKIQKLLWNEKGPLNFDARQIPRTQDLPPIFGEVSAAYVFSKETFLKMHRRIGMNPKIVAISGWECIDIDYPEDFEIANAVYKEILIRGGWDEEKC